MLDKELKDIFIKYAEQYRVIKRERYSLLKKMYFEQSDMIVYNYSQWLKNYNELLNRINKEDNKEVSKDVREVLIEIIDFSDQENDRLLQEIITICEKSLLESNAAYHEENTKRLITVNTYLLNLFNKSVIPSKEENNVVYLFRKKR